MPYDDPDFSIRRENFAGEAGGGTTTEYAKFRVFQASRLKKVHAFITTAGTATTHAINVYHGTTSIGAIALSTSTANANALGGVSSSALLDRVLAAGDQISVKTGADAVGKAHIIYEYEVTPDAVQS